jgi:glutamyl-tRNA reductase
LFQGLAITPTIQALRRKMDNIGQAELEKTLARMSNMTDADRKNLEKMVTALTSKILHDPLMYLKSESCAGRDNSDIKVTTVRELFGLTDSENDQ